MLPINLETNHCRAVDAKTSDNQWRVFMEAERYRKRPNRLGKEVERRGVRDLINQMDADGTKDGYDLALNRQVSESVGIPIIGSGGEKRRSFSGCSH